MSLHYIHPDHLGSLAVITDKTGLGAYNYSNFKPHAVEYIDDPDGLINNRTQTIEYNAFNKATILIDTVENDAYRLEITYGPDGQRWKTVLQKNDNITKTAIFAGDYEKTIENGVTKELVYLPGGGIYVKQAGQADKIYYTHTDHLGSVISITDNNGMPVFKASYDAWGQQTVTLNTIGFHRGYTGHEHLPEFGLINMNGRMYDPMVGRFLSPDPYVVDDTYSQDFNRYSYVRNNPLIYTDPSGEFIFTILAAIFCQPLVPAATQLDMAWMQGGFREMANGGKFLDGAGKGFVTGVVGGAMSMIGGGTFLANVAWGMGQGAITGGLNAALWDDDIGKGMLQGAAIGGAFAAATSGIEAYGNYQNGHGFRTNEGVIKNYMNNGQYQDAINYVQVKYGMTVDYQGNNVSMTYNSNLTDYGVADPLTGNIEIGPAAFGSSSELKATIVHEFGHSVKDRILDASGNFVGWQYPQGSFVSTNSTLATDGPLGYANEIFNAGKLHISPQYLKPAYNPLWSEWNSGWKWFYLMPRRYNSPVNLNWY